MPTCSVCGEPHDEPGVRCPNCRNERFVEGNEIGGGADEEEEESPDLDWEAFQEHAPPEKDRAGQRRGVYDSLVAKIGRLLGASVAVSGAFVSSGAAFVVLGGRFSSLGLFYRLVIGAAPCVLAMVSAGLFAHVRRRRRWVRDANILGAVGFLAAHLPDPTTTARTLIDEPVWFLAPLSETPIAEIVVPPIAHLVRTYAEFVAGIFGG